MAVEGLAPAREGRGGVAADCSEILLPGEGWTLVARGLPFTEGPAANGKGEVYFNDIPKSKAYKIDLEGKVSPSWLTDTRQANGQAFGPDGRLYAVAGGADEIIAYDQAGKPTVIADGFHGNDLVVRHDGGDVRHEPRLSRPGRAEQGLVHRPQGREEDRQLRAEHAQRHRTVARPDLLYVADYASHWVYSSRCQPDGSLAYKQKFYHLHVPDTADDAGTDGMRIDRTGACTWRRTWACRSATSLAESTAIIPTPNGRIANLCFGGPNFRHPLRHLRRPCLPSQGQDPGRERLPIPDQTADATL